MSPKSETSTWPLVVGVVFLAVSLVFFMVLVFIATLWDKEVPEGSRFLVVAILAIASGAASGFFGGYARAKGQLQLPYLEDPISFGVTGGIATLFLVLLLGHWLYSGATREHLAELKELTSEQEARLEVMKKEKPSALRPGSGAEEKSKFWVTGSTINVAFLDGNDELKEYVKELASQWTEAANIRFAYVTPTKSDIRVSFEQPGSWTYLGTDALVIPQNRPTLNLGTLKRVTNENERRRIVLEQFGHALGLIHEHQNPNGSIPWNWDAIYKSAGGPPMFWTRAEIDFNLRTPAHIDSPYRSKQFDPNSVMMHSFPPEWLREPLEISREGTLSPGDIAFVREIYP